MVHICLFRGTQVDSTTFTTSIKSTNALRALPTDIYTKRRKTFNKQSAESLLNDGASKRARSSDPCVISTVLYLLSYTCIYGAFELPTQAPSAGTQVFTSTKLVKMPALMLQQVYPSIYIPRSALGRYSIQLLRTSSYLLYLGA